MSRRIQINYDCLHFLGDRPCKPHKDEGVHCKGCQYYEPMDNRVLIIKLDAIGDVLRTTSILSSLKNKYVRSQITWITRAESVSIFYNNPYVDRVVDLAEAALVLETDKFDIVINLDASLTSSRLATIAKATDKVGYLYHELGYVYPSNPEAVEWFQMGIFDDIKRQNRKTYQQIALEICRLPSNADHELVLNLTDDERTFASEFAIRNGLAGKPVIGFNTGAGGRWQHKRWTLDGYLSLAELLKEEFPECEILLYGGPEERERNSHLRRRYPEFIDTGSENTIRNFAALIDLCDVLVTGDTLAMHIAIALKKKVVVLFGPTSPAEIELYGRGEKVIPDISCICCYKPSCNLEPNCMETISSERVLDAIKRINIAHS